MAKFWKNGIQFDCHQCGNCCTFEGGAIYASEEEFIKIANHLNISEEDFYKQYTFDINNLVSIKSHSDGPCFFYKNGCSIYDVRPTQCRTYPFWPEIMNN